MEEVGKKRRGKMAIGRKGGDAGSGERQGSGDSKIRIGQAGRERE